jgi:hypothetical protein
MTRVLYYALLAVMAVLFLVCLRLIAAYLRGAAGPYALSWVAIPLAISGLGLLILLSWKGSDIRPWERPVSEAITGFAFAPLTVLIWMLLQGE